MSTRRRLQPNSGCSWPAGGVAAAAGGGRLEADGNAPPVQAAAVGGTRRQLNLVRWAARI